MNNTVILISLIMIEGLREAAWAWTRKIIVGTINCCQDRILSEMSPTKYAT